MDLVYKATIAVAPQNMLVNNGTYIDLYWSELKANTWYCPSKGLVGASHGTWEVSRPMNFIELFDGKKLVAHANSDLEFNWLYYPFGKEMIYKGGKVNFHLKSAAFYCFQYTDVGVAETPECTWSFVKC